MKLSKLALVLAVLMTLVVWFAGNAIDATRESLKTTMERNVR